jgi:OOP family OmpA-OmpF porin
MKVGMRFGVASALLVTFAVGCSGVQRCMEKPWSTGAIGGAGAGAIAGGIGGGAAANNTGAFDIGDDNEDKALAISTGVIAGAAIGAILGHCLWDPDPIVPPPPPPTPAPAPEPVKQKIVLRGVNFDFDKATIRSDAASILAEAARILGENAGVNVSVEGHTDAVGTDAYNQSLSERRAAAVRDYLVAEGVGADRLTTKGFGESEPVASNETGDGRAQNRRVELTTLD